MWKKAGLILVILMIGPLLSMEGSGEPVEEDDEILYSTRIKEIYFGPKDDDDPPDGLFDVYSSRTDNLIFTFQLLKHEWRSGNETGNITPLQGGEVSLIFQRGNQKNISKRITDERGRVNFNFTSMFTDDITGEVFQITPYNEHHNITIKIEYKGNETCTETQRMRLGEYYDWGDGEVEGDSIFEIGYGWYYVLFFITTSVVSIIVVLIVFIVRRK